MLPSTRLARLWAVGSRSSGQRWGYDLLWYLSGVGIESTRNRRSPAKLGDVAQLARAPALQAGGRGFESHRLHQIVLVRTLGMRESGTAALSTGRASS